MRDLANSIAVRRAISPAAASITDNTPFVSQIIDLAGFGSAMFVILAGALADADATFTTLLEHGNAANLSDAAAVPDSQLIGTEAAASFTFADDNAVKKLGYVGPKQYLRLTITPANNTGAAIFTATAVLSNARYWPAG
jgi:hypothetical protein